MERPVYVYGDIYRVEVRDAAGAPLIAPHITHGPIRTRLTWNGSSALFLSHEIQTYSYHGEQLVDPDCYVFEPAGPHAHGNPLAVPLALWQRLARLAGYQDRAPVPLSRYPTALERLANLIELLDDSSRFLWTAQNSLDILADQLNDRQPRAARLCRDLATQAYALRQRFDAVRVGRPDPGGTTKGVPNDP